MIGINNIGSYIPQNFESNFDKKFKLNIKDDFIVNKIGVERVSRKLSDEDTSDLCVKAFQRLQEKTGSQFKDVDCIVVCTQNPDGNGIPHTSAVLHGKLGFENNCACFDISLGCSGYVYALSVVQSFMASNGLHSGLLFTADPYSKGINPEDKNTVLLFGDAATVTHLKEHKGGKDFWRTGKFKFSTFGRDCNALNNQSGFIFMNGRTIFNFVMKNVPVQIKELLKAEGLRSSEIDLFLFHQGSRYMIEQLRRILDLSSEKAPIQIAQYGNTISSSIPLMLETYLNSRKPQKIVMSGFGVGLSLASCLLMNE